MTPSGRMLSWGKRVFLNQPRTAASQQFWRNNPSHPSPTLRAAFNFCMHNALLSQPRHINVEDEVEIHCPVRLFEFQHFHLLSWLTVPNSVLRIKLFYSRFFLLFPPTNLLPINGLTNSYQTREGRQWRGMQIKK